MKEVRSDTKIIEVELRGDESKRGYKYTFIKPQFMHFVVDSDYILIRTEQGDDYKFPIKNVLVVIETVEIKHVP